MRTREGNSPDWIQIGEAFRNTAKPIREIAREHGISDAAIRKKAKGQGWSRDAANQPRCEPACEPQREQFQVPLERPARPASSPTVADLTARGRNIILALMAELEYLNQHAIILMELVEANFNGEKEAGTKAKLLKALDHEVRTKSSNQLATALAKLNDAAPGKKEQAEEDAKTAGQGSGWGDDLDTGIASRPN